MAPSIVKKKPLKKLFEQAKKDHAKHVPELRKNPATRKTQKAWIHYSKVLDNLGKVILKDVRTQRNMSRGRELHANPSIAKTESDLDAYLKQRGVEIG